MFGFSKPTIVDANNALPGREIPITSGSIHYVNGNPTKGPFPEGMETAIFAMGCYWGVERMFWQLNGVYTTAVGFIAGITPNPTYRETCTGLTGHTEAVLVVFDPAVISYSALLKVFWEGHDPTQGNRQGNDTGTQYRSGIYTLSEAQNLAARESKSIFQGRLLKAGMGSITSEIIPATEFYYAEEDHQQYLAKNPHGYCGVGGTGVTCPIGVGV